MKERLLVPLWLALLTALGYLIFPGHTWLHSDSQIYLPILEHLRDPLVLAKDLVATRPHVSFTIYDEVALAARALTGMDFRTVLEAQQLIYRFCGLLGVYLIARRLSLAPPLACTVTALFALGAVITGPAVLLVEYEPVPRGFAVPLAVLSIALLTWDRPKLAAVSLSLATLYHAPSLLPVWAAFVVVATLGRRYHSRSQILWVVGGFVFSVGLLLVLSRLQSGSGESQPLFARIAPDIESLQRFRAAYNWMELWDRYWIAHYAIGAALVFVALRQLRDLCPPDLRLWFSSLAVIGVVSMPVSYLLLDVLKWSLIPQIQPARAVVYVVVALILAGGAAAMHAATKRKWMEAAGWLALIIAIPAENQILNLILRAFEAPTAMRLIMVLVLAATLTACAAVSRARPALIVVSLLPILLIPGWGGVRNYPELDTPALTDLSVWALHRTQRDDIFLFPDVGRSLQPGIFRANSLRAVYVDRKAGGQVNFLPEFGREWWRRWQLTMEGTILESAAYRQLGVTYVVFTKGQSFESRQPVYQNAQYRVYSTAAQ